MDILPLRPLPSESPEARSGSLGFRENGFVDEAVICGLIARGVYERVYVQPEGLVLASCEDDYAGWALPVSSPFRGMVDFHAPTPDRLPAPPSRPAPPVSEGGLDPRYEGGHRWWLFAAGGAMTCGLLSLTLLSLANRAEIRPIATGLPPAPEPIELSAPDAGDPGIQPSLTRAQPDLH